MERQFLPTAELMARVSPETIRADAAATAAADAAAAPANAANDNFGLPPVPRRTPTWVSTQFKAPPAPLPPLAAALPGGGVGELAIPPLPAAGSTKLVSSAGGASADVWRHLAVGPKLGEGGYAVVYAAAAVTSGAPVVVKHIVAPWRNATDAQRTFREIMHQRDANHPNLLPLLGAWTSGDGADLFLALPPAGIDVSEAQRRGLLATDAHKVHVTFQLLCALKYLHSGGLMHRDLKPANLLVDESCTLRLCDFGLARSADADPDVAWAPAEATAEAGSRFYRAPELLVAAPAHTTAADIWSAGCVIAELWLEPAGRVLVRGATDAEQLRKVVELCGGAPKIAELHAAGRNDAALAALAAGGATRGAAASALASQMSTGAPADAAALAASLLVLAPAARADAAAALRHALLTPYLAADPKRAAYADASAAPRRFALPIGDGIRRQAYVYREYLYEHVARNEELPPRTADPAAAPPAQAGGAPAATLDGYEDEMGA